VNWPTLTEISVGITAIIGAIVAVWGIVRHVWPCSVRCANVASCALNRAKTVWAGLEDLPKMQEQFSEHKKALETVQSIATRVNEAVSVDGADSIPTKLAVLFAQSNARSLELAEHGQQLTRVDARLGMMDKKVDTIANTQRASLNTNPRMATFEADNNGFWTQTNRAYLKWTGLQMVDTLRWGWLNAVHISDRDRVRREWASCVGDTRRFECRFRMVNVNSGVQFEVDASADPIPEGIVPCERWFGTIYEVQTGALR
jgi:PAS domain-containing protein